jgi:hypothetical protein
MTQTRHLLDSFLRSDLIYLINPETTIKSLIHHWGQNIYDIGLAYSIVGQFSNSCRLHKRFFLQKIHQEIPFAKHAITNSRSHISQIGI